MDFDNSLDIISPDVASATITIGGVGSIKIPSGTAGQRPSTGLSGGMLRFITDTNLLEYYNGTAAAWKSVQVQSADLDAVSALSTSGLISRTGTATYATRSISVPAAGLAITNADGVAGNPTLSLNNDLGALENLTTTGIASRTAADTWTTRAITSGTGITITNGDGVAGNPTIALSSGVVTAGTYSLVTVDTYGRVTTGAFSQKSISILDVTSTENILWFYNPVALPLTQIMSVIKGTSTPSVTFSIRYGTDTSLAGTEVVTNGIAVSSVTTGLSTTTFNNGTIPAGNFVWITTSAKAGSVTQLNITIR